MVVSRAPVLIMNIRKILFIFASLVLLLTLVGGYYYYTFTKTAAFQQEHKKIRDHINIHKVIISTHIKSFQKNAELLAGLKTVLKIFETNNFETRAAVHSDLDYFQKTLDVSVCYLMDHLGNTFASSNRNTSTSFVGKNYVFRPYFKQAITGHPHVYAALGVTSGKRGVYYSHPVYLENSVTPAGIVVVKSSADIMKDVTAINRGDIFLITDPNGVVFISSDGDLLYKLVWKLPDNNLAEINQSRQFGANPLKWTGMTRRDEQNATDGQGNNYFIHQEDFEILPGWKIVYLHNSKTLSKLVYDPLIKRFVISLFLWISLVVAIIFLYKLASYDLSKRKEAENLLKHQATIDMLTGLPNRQLFQDRLSRALLHSKRLDAQFALLFIDLDKFKTVNDTLGHAAGDQLLREVSERIKQAVRESDTVARLGGDEFTVIVNYVSKKDDIIRVAQLIVETLSEPFFLSEKEANIGASIGIAVFPDDGVEQTTLMNNADSAMYQAKQSGRNQYCFFE